MRLAYKDTTQEFLQLLQTAVNNKDAYDCIHVSRLEMQQILLHSQSKSFLCDYWGPREQKIREIDIKLLALLHKLEHAATQTERQTIFNLQSDLETEKAKIMEIPNELTQSGIKIRVSMRA